MPAENGKQGISSRDLDNLIRVLSHQLKSPLNAIESLLNVILEGFTGGIDSKTSRYLKQAVGKTQEARKLISGLLRYEQFSDNYELKVEPVNLCGLLSTLAHSSHPAATAKNLTLIVEMPKRIDVMTHGSRAGLEAAFKNLIDNAINYTGERGNVVVSLETEEPRRVCQITIRDTGYGISKEDIPRLFEPFFRSSSIKGSIAGSGLGLAIVKRVIERHGGTIAVASAVNRGTTFTVTLPYTGIEEARIRPIPRKNIVIVGGVTAGPKAAARLRRLDETADITIVEKSELLSYAGCGIPSYVCGTVKSPKALMSTADNTLRDVHFFESIKNIRILNRTEAVDIDRGKKELVCRDRATGAQRRLPYDVLVLATGATSVVPDIKGISAPGICSLYNIEDAETLKRRFTEHPACDVCILGGGLIGIETAESLLIAGGRITVLEKDDYILKMFDADIARKIQHALNGKGIKVVTGVGVREIRSVGDRHLIVSDKGDFEADIIILSAGVKPNTELAIRAGLAISENRGIAVDPFLQTSDPAVYAVGDCAACKHIVSSKYNYLPLGSVSTKMGRIAADNIAGKKVEFPGCLGTAMFKLFDIQIARTGLTMREAQECGFDPVSTVVAGLDKAHYEAEARHIILKVIADRATQRLLGAQGFGRGEVAHRIELLGCAIESAATLEKMFLLDFGYFPAFNNPIDLAQTACLVLKNKIEGICKTIDNEEFLRIMNSVRIVDVSPPQEYSFSSIPGSINVPIENLRDEEFPFDRNERVVLYSKTSSRAYEAYRYLFALGYGNISMLEGGLVYWQT
jgi:NADPH-dependent 2,4-dienoyl-CoA reductase/sulfur reductase-like enzyme/rhodanese-related sulfurtransferase/two-component sensor histidine kinase